MGTSNNPLNYAEMTVGTTSGSVYDDMKCEECKKWEAENWNNPAGAVRECDCQFDYQTGYGVKRHIILPTCQKCGSAPCGCTSEERYGYPVSPENDLQIQTIGGFGENEQKPNWAIEADKQHKKDIAQQSFPQSVEDLVCKDFDTIKHFFRTLFGIKP